MNLSTLKNRVTAEHALLIFFLAVGLFFLIESRHLSDRAAAFPQFTAAATVIGALLLLFRSYLPWPLNVFVEDQEGMLEETVDDDVIDEIEEKSEAEVEDAIEQDNTESPEESRTHEEQTDDTGTEAETRYVEIAGYEIHGGLFTALASVGFVVLGYLIGLLWAAPAFVAAYLAALGRSKRDIAVLAVVAFVIAFSFYAVIGLDIDGGLLFEPPELTVFIPDVFAGWSQ